VIAAVAATKAGADKLKSIGYVGANTTPGRPQRTNPDWTHFNGVAYNPEFDQIMVSVHSFSEFWIIDHSTTTPEAASHHGGKSGKGGDLLYRWGNPRTYRGGTKADQRLFSQHNAHWIPPGQPGEGHVLVFNNGSKRPDGTYSSVDELILPVDTQGHYAYKPGTPYGPDKAVWSYTAPKKTDFYSFFISGAQRLPNGNTLICSGANGTIIEVTPDKETVWKYVNPVKGNEPGGASPPQPGQILPSFVRDMLSLSPEQRRKLGDVQKDVDGKLDKLLTADQKKKLKESRPMFGPGAPRPQAGQILASADQDRLKLTGDQKKQLSEAQKDVDRRLEEILQDQQKKQLKDMRNGPPFGGGPGGPPMFAFGPGGPGGPPQPGQLVPSFVQDMLRLSDGQKKDLEAFQKEVSGKLHEVLTAEQTKQFEEAQRGPGAFQPGQLMALPLQIRLKLSPEQRKQIQALQKEADAKLDKVLADDQKKQFKEMRANFGRGGPGGFGPGGPGGPGGPNFGPPGGSAMFRAYRYAANYPGLVGKDLKPGKKVEELQPKESNRTAAR
jgi:Arylsulfotransferase (ASST)